MNSDCHKRHMPLKRNATCSIACDVLFLSLTTYIIFLQTNCRHCCTQLYFFPAFKFSLICEIREKS
nr:MAG TPA: glutaredoxin-like domain protein [Caudoviricetes sp.]